ncbi:MAG: hypothetical protein WBD74_10875 [Candidatus Aquilonibacter sp.]
MASIAQYLLHLASNPHAAELHNSSSKSADLQMRAYGLDDDQRAVIATGDKQKISNALANELPPAAEPGKTMTFQISPTVLLHGGGGN